ncbi:GRAM domain-containing protein 4-like isoform X1 [Tachypleus tridentatus]|uniref:GRAM domain-containing protein 4-like isoform X1 n=1 Tax=Tachypleus tridentatus TaxID=6853 RepID=UPI003FD63E07
MSLRQAIRSKFRSEKPDAEKEPDTPPSASTSLPFRNFQEDEMCLLHEDVLGQEEESLLQAEVTQDSRFLTDHLRSAYETQLNQLHEQLLAAILENQQLSNELKQLREQKPVDFVKELEKEKEKNRFLTEKLHEKDKDMKDKETAGSKSPRLRRLVRREKHDRNRTVEVGEFQSSSVIEKDEWVDIAKEVTEKDYQEESPTEPNPPATVSGWRHSFRMWLHDWFSDFLEDFSETTVEEEDIKETEKEGDPLTVKKLKENILRFGYATKPIVNAMESLTGLLHWNTLGTTLLAFGVYMYTVCHGWFLPLLLFLANCQLLLNYFRYRGWFSSCCVTRKNEQEEADRDLGVSDKFQLVLQVARKVQNQSGRVADCCEKIKNLLLWEEPDVMAQLYFFLLAAFVASCVFPASQLFTAAGLYLGVKLFLVDYVFYRFPRVQQKYDTAWKMWKSLPTDAELEKKHSRAEIDRNVINQAACHLSLAKTENQSFRELFNLPVSESPLPAWHAGRRCTLINRDKSLTSAFKNGRLYLTNSFLCFERSRTPNVKNLVLPLKNIVRFEKAKPYPWIPGGGMALEVTMEKPEKQTYIFGAILNRDETYDSVLEAGRRASLPWALHPTESHNDEGNSKKQAGVIQQKPVQL